MLNVFDDLPIEPVAGPIDHRDLAIRDLADREAELLDRVAAQRHEIELWRSMVANILGYLHTVLVDGHDGRYRERHTSRRSA
jgi:hypothetical protein